MPSFSQNIQSSLLGDLMQGSIIASVLDALGIRQDRQPRRFSPLPINSFLNLSISLEQSRRSHFYKKINKRAFDVSVSIESFGSLKTLSTNILKLPQTMR